MKTLKFRLLNLLYLLCVIFASCDTHQNYLDKNGNPTYKISLLNAKGDLLEVRYAHEKYDSWDWGIYKNYEFRYWRWRYYKDSKKWGRIYLETWGWNKERVIIERGDYKNLIKKLSEARH